MDARRALAPSPAAQAGVGLSSKRMAVVSNRLPVSLNADGTVSLSAGGLVTALSPVLQKRGGVWIGWPGTEEDVSTSLAAFSADQAYDLEPVSLSPEEAEAYYSGFSNEILWPLFHGFPGKCRFEPHYWEAYNRVNEKFAQTIAQVTTDSDYVWVHDYHLLLVAQNLQALHVRRQCGFYLHIPFPPPEIFFALPWREQILSGLSCFDFVGFQTPQDEDNFLRSLYSFSPQPGSAPIAYSGRRFIPPEDLRTGALPISIDFSEFSDAAERCRRDPEPPAATGFLHATGRTMLGVDRLDYTKGIPHRLQAFRQLLLDFPEHRGSVTLLQVVVPSREQIGAYHQLKEEIEALVGEINGQFASPEWTPIRYLYRSLRRQELIATYMQAELALITPLRDGMNLVAKEYCACKNDLDGVLVLSEFAGASRQLGDSALLVNPYDVMALARTMDYGLRLSKAERRARMFTARERIRSEDISWWLESFLTAAAPVAGHLERGPAGRPRPAPGRSRERHPGSRGFPASVQRQPAFQNKVSQALRKARKGPQGIHKPGLAS